MVERCGRLQCRVIQFANLVEALDAAPGCRPFITAWVNEDEEEAVTFREFRHRARGQAASMEKSGVNAGDRVIIIMPQSIEAMAAFAGAMILGAVPAFLAYPNEKFDPAKYCSGLAGVTENLKAKLVVVDKEFPQEALAHISLTEKARLLRLGDDRRDDGADKHWVKPQPKDLAFIQHSAGTTGLQKGVALTHAAVLRQVSHLVESLGIDDMRDRIYSWLPLYHDMGLIACFILPMVSHIPLVMQSPIDWVMRPETMLHVITENRCTLAWMPNFALLFMARRTRADRRKKYELSSLRALINCSEPVRADSMREFTDAFHPIGLQPGTLHSCYAMAENVFAVSQSKICKDSGPMQIWADGSVFRSASRISFSAEGSPGAVSFISSGCLLPGNEIRIVSDSGATLADGEVGEILIKSDCLFTGYYNRPDLTALTFVDGWYKTGDLGFCLQGEVFVVGRTKDLIIVGGENIHPQDIEEIASGHPAIHDGRVICLGVYNAELGTEEIVLIAEVETGELLAHASAIESEIRSRVAAGMGVTVTLIVLKPPKWIVKSTAGKAARSATLEKLRREHPEINLGRSS